MKYFNLLCILVLGCYSKNAVGQCSIDLGNDTAICASSFIVLEAGSGYDSYLWQDGSTNPVFPVLNPGTYWCEVTVLQSNLIVNGDFENGATNFTSDYTLGTGGTWGPVSLVQTYYVTTSPNIAHSNFPICGDHTSGTGNMFVVNGASTVGQDVWCQTVAVTPNTDYFLSAWFQSYNTPLPDVTFMINGSQVGTSFSTAPNQSCDWLNHSVTWNSGANTSADICFVNNELAPSGNDFAIDDISFGSVCIARDTIEVVAGTIAATLSNFMNEGCDNAANGEATFSNINSLGGGPFTVTWTNPSGNVHATDNVIQGGSAAQTNLTAGAWQVLIEDDNGCSWDTTLFLQAEAINVSTNIGHPQCFGTATGSITAFSTTAGVFSFDIQDSNGNSVNNPGTNTANSLVAGTYTVSIVDDNGCEISETVQIIDPPAITVNLSLTHPLCNGFETGIATVDTVYNAQGNYAQIYYGWDPNPNNNNGLGVTSINGLSAGEYVLEIVDDIGCSNEVTFFILEPDPLVGVLEVISPTYCRTTGYQKGNGEVTVTTAGVGYSGVGNVTYLWQNLENGDESTNTTFIVDVPGQMKVTLTDGNGCIFTDTIQVDSINPIADFTPVSDQFEGPGAYEGLEEMEVEFVNESVNFAKTSYALSDTTFKWNLYANQTPGGEDNWFFSYDYDEKIDTNYMGEATYLVCLVAKNFNDCRDTICKPITVHAIVDIAQPNVFTPSSGPNQLFYFTINGIDVFDCRVFNRYGVEVFRYTSVNDAWDGNNFRNGKPCADGVYFYSYTAMSTSGTEIKGQGNIHLIRAE